MFQQISADTKDLDDIPHYWPQAQRLELPVIQYTARDVRSGLLFWAFAERRSAAASAVFAARIQQHLDRYGISLRDLVWQTDNGGEFKGDFPHALGDSQHVRIPPAAHTYQSDVETVHRLEEDEFFDLESSPAAATSSPRPTPISSTSTSCAPTPTRKIRAPGKSSSGSLRARRLNSACFHPSSWIITSTTQGDTMCPGFPPIVTRSFLILRSPALQEFERGEIIKCLMREHRDTHSHSASGCAAAGIHNRHEHGSQYRSDDYQAEIALLGMESSPSFVRQPECNGCVERFIRTLKEQLLWVRVFQNVEELRCALAEFRERYNQRWIVQRLGYLTPAQARQQLLALGAAA